MVKKLLLLTSIVYTIVLVIATLINLSGIPSLGSSFDDKIYHFIAYLGLAFLWITYFKPSKRKHILVIVFISEDRNWSLPEWKNSWTSSVR